MVFDSRNKLFLHLDHPYYGHKYQGKCDDNEKLYQYQKNISQATKYLSVYKEKCGNCEKEFERQQLYLKKVKEYINLSYSFNCLINKYVSCIDRIIFLNSPVINLL